MNRLYNTLGLLESAYTRKVRLYEQTEWKGHKQEKDTVIFYTKNHHSIKAHHIIFAGGYANQSIKPDKNAVLTSSYNIVTKPVADFSSWPNRILIWETARPYIYLRTTPDHRIIIGGLDEATTIAEERDKHLHSKKDQLLIELNRRFPNIQVEAEFYLGAFYGGTHDGLPILGIYDEFPRCTFLNAYGDNGLVYSMVLARILRDMLTGVLRLTLKYICNRGNT
ncbi:NAD(P)/FAD-dependent oxidoreductase [Paenibacillus wynnii]|uniref:NAD(P)/FAD-dependent oxidoreductase n=1 Tax=Paenibacillus wynnii TaxID=268407 RepID=UPI00278FB834|nr:FAD-binding oxidoreductase [Paenibacillus wynnii]MDQ0195001.1 glycine/D-amino acid oxidase-like deaminating enzyme [Paenibacillus wynnii]